MDKKEILKSLLEVESIELILSGDYGFIIPHKDYKNGLDINIEIKNDYSKDGDKNEEIFYLSAYELLETEIGELQANMEFSEIQFYFSRKELELLDERNNISGKLVNEIKNINKKEQEEKEELTKKYNKKRCSFIYDYFLDNLLNKTFTKEDFIKIINVLEEGEKLTLSKLEEIEKNIEKGVGSYYYKIVISEDKSLRIDYLIDLNGNIVVINIY